MAAQCPAPGVIPPLRKRVPELARTVVSRPVLVGDWSILPPGAVRLRPPAP
jgi:hypothetical protein